MAGTSREGQMQAYVEPDPRPPRAFTHSASTPTSVAPTAAIVDDLERFEPEPDAIAYVIVSPGSSFSSGAKFDY